MMYKLPKLILFIILLHFNILTILASNQCGSFSDSQDDEAIISPISGNSDSNSDISDDNNQYDHYEATSDANSNVSQVAKNAINDRLQTLESLLDHNEQLLVISENRLQRYINKSRQRLQALRACEAKWQKAELASERYLQETRELCHKISRQERCIKMLQGDCQESKQYRDSQANEIEKLSRRIYTVQNDREQMEQRKNCWKGRCRRSNSRLAEKTSLLNDRAIIHTEEMTKAQDTIKSWQSQVASYKESTRRIQHELTCKSKFSLTLMEKIEEATGRIEQLQATAANNRQELIEARTKVASLEQELSEAKGQHVSQECFQALQEENILLQRKCDGLQQQSHFPKTWRKKRGGK